MCNETKLSTFVALRTFTRVRLLDLQQNSEALEKEERRIHQGKMRHNTLKRLVLIVGIISIQYLRETARTAEFEMMYLPTLVRCYPFERFVYVRSCTRPSIWGRLLPHRNTSVFKHTVLLSLSFPWDLAMQFRGQRQASVQENGFSMLLFLIVYLRGN
jgi:hypothetical protein